MTGRDGSHGDRAHMLAALALARRGLGQVAPNPAVGCVLVAEGRVVGRGSTRPGGRPHAETEALGHAGDRARGATAYVTLEPCAHHGRTPPCAEALVAAGIGRCVVALEDPDPRVAGRGLARLREAGIAVEVGLCAAEAGAINAGYLLRQGAGRPLVTLKLATSLDGRIATASGESRWITGAQARALAHVLRAEHDAVLVGSGTAVADNPRLDVRLPGLAHRRPLRVLLDGRLRVPLTHGLVADAVARPTLLFTLDDNPGDRMQAYRAAGVELAVIGAGRDGRLDLTQVLSELGRRGLSRVMVEGGGHLAAALLARDLVDRLVWFRAPLLLGGDGRPAVAGFGLEALRLAPRFGLTARAPIGDDLVEYYERLREPGGA